MRTILILIATMFTTSVYAADGSSGCGPGWYAFKDNSLVSSTLRSTTNGLLFPAVTIGMTMGTSNCSKHSIVMKEKESLHFVTNNHFELQSDVARGNGEYVSSYASTIGCQPAGQKHLQKMLKDNYNKIYPNSEIQPEKVLIETYRLIFTDKTLAEQCVLAG